MAACLGKVGDGKVLPGTLSIRTAACFGPIHVTHITHNARFPPRQVTALDTTLGGNAAAGGAPLRSVSEIDRDLEDVEAERQRTELARDDAQKRVTRWVGGWVVVHSRNQSDHCNPKTQNPGGVGASGGGTGTLGLLAAGGLPRP